MSWIGGFSCVACIGQGTTGYRLLHDEVLSWNNKHSPPMPLNRGGKHEINTTNYQLMRKTVGDRLPECLGYRRHGTL